MTKTATTLVSKPHDYAIADIKLADYGRKIDDVRSALNWAFSESGDVRVGISLFNFAITAAFFLRAAR